MPCRDYYDDHPQQYYKDATEPGYKKQISFAESALCAALKVVEAYADVVGHQNPYSMLNFEESGITEKELRKWHKDHKELDAKHRAAEAAKKAKVDLKEHALAKLTQAERDVLQKFWSASES